MLLTLSAGERPVGGSRQSSEPGYWGGADRMEVEEVEEEEAEVEAGGGQGVLRSRPGETGSDLMLTPEAVLTVSMAPCGMWETGLWGATGRGRKMDTKGAVVSGLLDRGEKHNSCHSCQTTTGTTLLGNSSDNNN